VVFLGRLARGKEGEGRLVRDNQLACMRALAWHGKMVEVQGKMARGSWAQGSWARGSSALGS
jgi:hypothetical protein